MLYPFGLFNMAEADPYSEEPIEPIILEAENHADAVSKFQSRGDLTVDGEPVELIEYPESTRAEPDFIVGLLCPWGEMWAIGYGIKHQINGVAK